jgi:hypothetical protein
MLKGCQPSWPPSGSTVRFPSGLSRRPCGPIWSRISSRLWGCVNSGQSSAEAPPFVCDICAQEAMVPDLRRLNFTPKREFNQF